MRKVLSMLIIILCAQSVLAQNRSLYLNSAQDIYFAGDSIICTLALVGKQEDASAIFLEFFNGEGKKLDQYYANLTLVSAKKIMFFAPTSAESGWYYIKASAANGSLQSNTLRLLLLNSSDDIAELEKPTSVDTIALFTEGASHLVYDLPGILFIKVDENTNIGYGLRVVLKNSRGFKLNTAKPDQDGFVKFNFTPQNKEKYYVELVQGAQVIATKPVPDNFFSEKEATMNLEYVNNEILKARVSSLSKALFGITIRHISSNITVESFVVGANKDFELYLSKYPAGLLKLSVYNGRKKLLLERIVFNKKNQISIISDSVLNFPAVVKRGEMVLLDFNLSQLENKQLMVESAILSIRDTRLNILPNDNNPYIAEADLESLKYYFSELAEKANKKGRSAKSLDNYFAINQYPTYAKSKTSNTSGEIEGHNITLAGTLYDGNYMAIPNKPVILTIPTNRDGLSWTITDEDGSFLLPDLNFTDGQEAYLTPVFSESASAYNFKIKEPQNTNDFKDYRNYIVNSSWGALSQSLALIQNIKKSYEETKDISVMNLVSAKDKTKKLTFSNVDYDLSLNEYELPEQMEKLINPVIPGVNVRRGKLRIFSTELGRQFKRTPLLLIDGVPYFDIDSLLSIDPVRFERVQVITTLNKLAPFGKIGSAGIISFYTRKGFTIVDNFPTLLNISGYRRYNVPDKNIPKARGLLTPHILSSYVYNIFQPHELASAMSVTFTAPDVTTNLNVELTLITKNGVLTINKIISVEK
jgi:hypothetical protein